MRIILLFLFLCLVQKPYAAALSSDEDTQVTALANRIVPLGNRLEVYELSHAIKSISSNDRTIVLEQVAHLIRPWMVNYDVIEIIYAVRDLIHKSNCRDMIEGMQSLMVMEKTKGHNIKDILKVLSTLNIEELPILVGQVASLMYPWMEGYDAASLAAGVKGMPLADRISVINNTKLVVIPRLDGADVVRILGAFFSIAAAERPLFAAQVKEFGRAYLVGGDGAFSAATSVLAGVPLVKRTKVLALAPALINKSLRQDYTKVDILRFLIDLPDLEAHVEPLGKIFKCAMCFDDIIDRLLFVLKDTPDLLSVFRIIANEFVGLEKVGSPDLPKLTAAICRVKPEERDHFVSQFRRLILPRMFGYDIANIAFALAQTEVSQREALITEILTAIPGSVDGGQARGALASKLIQEKDRTKWQPHIDKMVADHHWLYPEENMGRGMATFMAAIS